jgi:hypothetical protein
MAILMAVQTPTKRIKDESRVGGGPQRKLCAAGRWLGAHIYIHLTGRLPNTKTPLWISAYRQRPALSALYITSATYLGRNLLQYDIVRARTRPCYITQS